MSRSHERNRPAPAPEREPFDENRKTLSRALMVLVITFQMAC
jgi:hypothetical protein